jgi:hypothetical protein
LRPVLELAVVAVFALLVWNNYSLRRQHAAAAAVRSARAFLVHDSVAPVSVTDLAGAPQMLPLNGRTIVAVVDPRCDSCRELLSTIRPDSGAQVLSVAPLAETRTMAQTAGLNAVTHVLQSAADRRFQIYPQLFVVERNQVVRTCASMTECR